MTLLKLQENYYSFIRQPDIQNFIAHQNGKVFIATEGRSAKLIRELFKLGHRHFCEKYVQETYQKWASLADIRAHCVLHNFGHIQSNKLKKSYMYFDGLESVDRPKLALKIHRLIDQFSSRDTPKLYVQLNVGEERQKKGVSRANADDLMAYIQALNLPVHGVMGIPPLNENPIPYFKLLRRFADQYALTDCVMGMSADYNLAIDHGSTHIRVGTVIFKGVEDV